MHDYSFWCPVVTVGALFTDGRMDGQIIGSRTRLDDISTAELKALSCAKKGLITMTPRDDIEMETFIDHFDLEIEAT